MPYEALINIKKRSCLDGLIYIIIMRKHNGMSALKYLSLRILPHVSTSTRSSSGCCIQKRTNTANSVISFTEFAVLFVLLFIHLHDDDLVEVERRGRILSDKRLFIIDCAVVELIIM